MLTIPFGLRIQFALASVLAPSCNSIAAPPKERKFIAQSLPSLNAGFARKSHMFPLILPPRGGKAMLLIWTIRNRVEVSAERETVCGL
jgi:hypothetical protein